MYHIPGMWFEGTDFYPEDKTEFTKNPGNHLQQTTKRHNSDGFILAA
jgi:hypothetical protein